MRLYAVARSGESRSNSSLTSVEAAGFRHLLLTFGVSDGQSIISAKRHGLGVLLDSGAFLVAMGRLEIDLADYVRFCQRFAAFTDAYACLDVIGNAEATWRNQLAMESEGLHPLPTFHYGSPVAALNRLLERYEYIALGGIAKVRRDERVRWLDGVWPRIRAARADMRVHGWGVTDWTVLERYPWFSIDSTTWFVGSAYGASIERRKRVPHRVAREGLPPALRERTDAATRLRIMRTALVLQDYVRYCTALWKERGVEWPD